MKYLNAFQLIPGQRYWLDKVQDVSAIFDHMDNTGVYFREPEGVQCYHGIDVLGVQMIKFLDPSLNDFYCLVE